MSRHLHGACLGAALLLLGAGCGTNDPRAAALDALRLPTGAALDPGGGWLFVVNSNLDQRETSATLVALDLDAVDEGLASPLAAGAETSRSRPCRKGSEGGPTECAAHHLIDPKASVRLPSGAGNIGVDRPFGDDGIARLLIPASLERAITWIDVDAGGRDLEVECGQDLESACDDAHTLTHRFNDPDSTPLPLDAARIEIDTQGFRYAYLPHLTGAVMSMVDLSGVGGPEISEIEGDFFRPDPYAEKSDTEYAGGFAVAQRPCDPEHPAAITLECARPHLFVSHRFWPGLREFTVAVGADVVLARGDLAYIDINPGVVDDRPYMGDLAFEDESGERMLMVSTTPPFLLRLDTSLDDEGEVKATVIESVALCRNPNVLALDRPEGGEAFAYVSCYSDDQIAAVALGSFQVAATIDVGDGPNELVIDAERRRLYVVETLGGAVAVIDIDRASPRQHDVIARIGG